MYCPSCGNEITVELKYCNRCGANLSSQAAYPLAPVVIPLKLTAPTLVVGLTIVAGLGIIFGGVSQLAAMGLHPAALAWIVLFSMATLFGCTALLLRFWLKMMTVQRESASLQSPARQPVIERPSPQQLPPRFEPLPSVTENTTRTFTPVFREPSDR